MAPAPRANGDDPRSSRRSDRGRRRAISVEHDAEPDPLLGQPEHLVVVEQQEEREAVVLDAEGDGAEAVEDGRQLVEAARHERPGFTCRSREGQSERGHRPRSPREPLRPAPCGGQRRKLPVAVATGLAASSCHATTRTFAMRRPCFTISARANVSWRPDRAEVVDAQVDRPRHAVAVGLVDEADQSPPARGTRPRRRRGSPAAPRCRRGRHGTAGGTRARRPSRRPRPR